jgi:hypothetical protein
VEAVLILAHAMALVCGEAFLAGPARFLEDGGDQVKVTYQASAKAMDKDCGGAATGVQSFLASLTPGPPQAFGSLIVIPLVSGVSAPKTVPGPFVQNQLTATDQVMGQQTLVNDTPAPQLALLGQVMEGRTTQDRFYERSTLIREQSRRLVTAYCCEQNFEARRDTPLATVPFVMSAPVRLRRLHNFVRAVGDLSPGAQWTHPADEDQLDSWAHIIDQIADARINSPWRAYLDVARAQADASNRLVDGMTFPRSTVGFAVGSGEELMSVECFGSEAQVSPGVFRSLLGSYYPLALRPGVGENGPGLSAKLKALLSSLPPAQAYLPEGTECTVVLSSQSYSGLAVVDRGKPLHVLLASASAAGGFSPRTRLSY